VAPTYPERELTQAEVERLARLDGKEARDCGDAAMAYVDHITSRDRALVQFRVATRSSTK
jgi:diaminopimelate epimerase